MLYFYSIIFGAIQALTEFLPISSSAHLVIFHDLLKFDLVDNLSFDVALHLGTLLAMILFFATDIVALIRGWLSSLKNWNLKNDLNQRLSWFIIIGTIPAAVVGYFFDNWFENNRGLILISLTLIGGGILLFLVDLLSKKQKEISEIKFGGAFSIGLAQVLALIPGVSRSGINIIAGLANNLKREAAARYAFLLGIPIIFGAGVKKIYDLTKISLTSQEIIIFILGFLTSAMIGYLVIKFFLGFLKNHSLKWLAIYRIIIGIIILVIILFL